MSDTTLYENRNEPTGPAGDSAEANPDFIKLKKWVIQAHRARSNWRKETVRAFDFVANRQWDKDDKFLLDSQNRPAVTFNRAAPIIKAVCGLEVNNRQSVVYLPRKQGDVDVDEARTDAAKWVRDVCEAEDEESEAFRSLVICGEGWTEWRMDYTENVTGRIVKECIDSLEMGVNAGAKRSNYLDARLMYRVRDMDTEDGKALFDDKYDAETINAKWMQVEPTPEDGGQGNKTDYPDATRTALERQTGLRTKVRIVQVQWWELEPLNLVAVEGADKLQEMNDDEFAKFNDRVTQMQQLDAQNMAQHNVALAAHITAAQAGLADPAQPPQPPQPTAPKFTSAKSKRRCYYEAFLGMGLLSKKPLPLKDFSFKCMTGERDRTGNCFYGLMRDMFDPQMWANKWVSQTMHIMNTNAKGGIMAETDAFVDARKAEKDWADNTKIIWVKPGSLTKKKVQERTPPPLPQGLGELMQFALGSLRDVTGINLELLGQADREQAASLEAQRRQAAMTILATMFDSLRRYRKQDGKLLLKFLGLLPPGTLYRALDQGKYKFVPMVQMDDPDEYDIIIDEAPTSPDQKQYVWATTMQLLGQGIPMPPNVIAVLLKYSPYPASVVQEITDAMGLGTEMPPEMLKQKLDQAEQALQVMEQELQKAMQEAHTEQQKVDVQSLKATVDVYKAETERLAAQWTAKISSIQAVADAAAEPKPTAGGDGQQAGGQPQQLTMASLAAQVASLQHMLETFTQAGSPPPPVAQPAPQGV